MTGPADGSLQIRRASTKDFAAQTGMQSGFCTAGAPTRYPFTREAEQVSCLLLLAACERVYGSTVRAIDEPDCPYDPA